MEAIKTMSNMEMKMQHMEEIYYLNRQELETKTAKLNQVIDIIDNHIQRHDDTFRLSNDTKARDAAYYKVKALRDVEKEIAVVMVKEE